MRFQPNFDHCKNSKAVTYILPGLLSWQWDLFELQSKMARPKNFKMKFWMPYQKSTTQNAYLMAIQFCAGEIACGPKKHCFWDRMNLNFEMLGLHRIYPTLNIKATNTKNVMLRFCLDKYNQKNITSKFPVKAFWMKDCTGPFCVFEPVRS